MRIDLSKAANVRRISYRRVVYVKAVELREFNVSIGWDAASRTVVLRSNLAICPGQISQIMSRGATSEVQLQIFLRDDNQNALSQRRRRR